MELRNIRIWDGRAEGYLEADGLTIGGARITRIGDPAPDAIDGSGLTVLPGLMDAHVHLCLDPDVRSPDDQITDVDALLPAMRSRAEAMVRAGITTARDLGGETWAELRLRDEIAEGGTPGPRLLCAGQPITSVGGHCHFWGGEAADANAALEVLKRQTDRGTDLIKVMATGGTLTPNTTPADAQFDTGTIAAIVEASAASGRHVAAHCHGTAGIINAVEAGVRTVEHCSWVGPDGWGKHYDEAAVASMAAKGTWVSPTINLGWARFRGNKPLESLRQDNLAKLRAAGVGLIASTDAGIPGVRHHDLAAALREFAHFAGLQPGETLRAATSDCARALGIDTVTGAIDVGLEADLMVVEGDPLDDLAVLATPVEVIARGRAMLGTLANAR